MQFLRASDRGMLLRRCPIDGHEAAEFLFGFSQVRNDGRTYMSIDDGDHGHAGNDDTRCQFNRTGINC